MPIDTRNRDYIVLARETIESLSRTAHGISDTSSSVDKKELVIAGDSLAERASVNLESALLWGIEASKGGLNQPSSVLAFVLGVAAHVSLGLMQSDQPLYRTWPTKVPYQTAPSDIPAAMLEFASSFVLLSASADPVDVAAFVEYEIDGVIHPFADGCGRTARACSIVILAHAQRPLPNYPSRETYYDWIGRGWPAWRVWYRTFVA